MGLRILVVEDEKDVQSLLKMTLEFTGQHTVLTADDGLEGLRLAESEMPDLILLDVMMPHMDGYEVLQQLRSNPKTREIPVIFLSARAQRREIERGLQMGAAGYLTKPFNPATLNEEMMEIYRRLRPEGG
ncbi:MAG: response regulator [Candidatus Poribacteria bacterium]|nr:MAG: response regulator [Candidatus Poribacteria bacterium]